MKKKIKVTFKRKVILRGNMPEERYIVESLTNIGALSVSPSKMVRVGDDISAAELDYVCERSRAEVFTH
jgi:hypothetical protein